MAQIGDAVSARVGTQALMPHRFISDRHARLDPNFSVEMYLTGPSLTSPSRSRALTTSAAQQGQMSRTQSPSVDFRSGEPSQNHYSLHPSRKDPTMGKSQRSMNEPRYVENYLNISHANRNTDQQWESTSSPASNLGHPLTPLSDPSSRMSEDGELRQTPAPSSQCSGVQTGTEERQSRPPETDAVEEFDWMPNTTFSPLRNNCEELSSEEDDDMDDEERDSDSEQDYFEERKVLIDEELEASVLRATGYNYDLAARLICQLHKMYQQEEFPVAQTWQPCFHRCAGEPSDYNMGTSGLDFNSFSSYTGQNTNDRKRQREDDEDNGEEESNSRDRNGGGDRGNKMGDGSGNSNSRLLGCPFNKRYPNIYNHLSRPPGRRKGDYTTCESGFDTDQRFK